MSEEHPKVPLPDLYTQLNNTGRHYDQKLWVVPGTAIGLSALIAAAAFKADTSTLGRLTLSIINAAAFSGFLVQFVKDRCFQLANQAALDRLDPYGAFVGDLSLHPKDRWFIRFAKQHVRAVNYMFYVLLIVLGIHCAIAISSIVAAFTAQSTHQQSPGS